MIFKLMEPKYQKALRMWMEYGIMRKCCSTVISLFAKTRRLSVFTFMSVFTKKKQPASFFLAIILVS